MNTHLITSNGQPFMLVNNAGSPVTLEQAQIDPKTIIDKLQIGTHISWKTSRCIGNDYRLSVHSDSGIIADFGPKHFYVLTDRALLNGKPWINIHFLHGFRLDSVACMGIEFIPDNDPQSKLKCTDINAAMPFRNANNYTYNYQYNDSNIKLTDNRNYKTDYPTLSKYFTFIEEGEHYDYFKHRDCYDKPMGIAAFHKTNRPSFLDISPFKNDIEKYFETQ